jgi:uncharacterized repeat protein (TIGR03803 family)
MVFIVVLVLAALAQAQTFTIIYNFTGGSDGGNPYTGLIQDPAGNLYGTAVNGGSGHYYADGVVFRMDTAGTETVLYSFGGYPDGGWPETPVVRDKAGNIYGTTGGGGSSDCGVVFKIDPKGNENVLHSFSGSDGCGPLQGLVADKTGNLYGTTTPRCYLCSGYGTIFQVDKKGHFTLLHSFTGDSSDGAYPYYGHLAVDESGNLYGLTWGGGSYGYGVLYKLSKSGKFTVLHSFNNSSSDGCYPYGSVLIDEAGSLYGTTSGCGSYYYGTIWKVNKQGKETVLHSFAGSPSDGCTPYTGVAQDTKGNLYGVTAGCGLNYYYGTVYELSAKRKLTLLHSFDGADGEFPIGEVLRTSSGTLFGTAYYGGTSNCRIYYSTCGTVWSYVP